MRDRLPVLALVAATLVMAGCGGSSSKPSSRQSGASGNDSTDHAIRPTDATSAGLVGTADAICARRNAQVHAVAVTAKTVSNSEVIRLAAEEIPIERAAVAELRKLTPSATTLGDWQRFLTYREMLVEKLVKLGEYATRNDNHAMTAVLNSSNNVEEQLLVLERDGFKHCAVVESIK